MTLRRYSRAPLIRGGKSYGTSRSAYLIHRGVELGIIESSMYTTTGDDRLDILAGRFYGDGRLWWVLAAASGIGWGLQVPPGTVIKVPKISQVSQLVG
mgnify:CR=1 FL=1